ncbi:hypothetical protein ACHAWU_006955 [Discostella pseudostelligera]|uniref:40S ribosomal protein S25 n=1 Tax=Discostella pseudostelligera TaxID=259834 RepID=A0ABD3MIA9_9STRA
MAAAMAGGKGKKKKWSKGKQRDKVDNKISGGLARRALNQLCEDGEIKAVCVTRSQRIYTRNIDEGDDE